MNLPVAEPRRRLHPLSPLLRGARLAAIAIAAISWQGYRDLGTNRWLIGVVLVALVVLAGSAVSWYVTGYHVIGRELRVYEGLLWRRTRAIPLERLQSVELVRPLLARLFGLAELRLEVVGAAKTEAPLAFLTQTHALALRSRLLELAGASRAGAPGVAAATQPGAVGTLAPEQVVHVVRTSDLVLSQLLRPQWWLLPLAVAAPVVAFATGNDLSAIAIASTVTAAIGAVAAPVRVLLGDWRFTVASAVDGLRLRRGLLETRSQTVPAGRVQSVLVAAPLLWRGMHWVRVHFEVAGIPSRDDTGGAVASSLLPVGTLPVAERIIALAVPGFSLAGVRVIGVPARARWLAPLRRRVLGCQLTDSAFVSQDGLLTRRLHCVPYQRIQSIRLYQGPVQRLLGLATLWVDTAGGVRVGAPHRDLADARALAKSLADRTATTPQMRRS